METSNTVEIAVVATAAFTALAALGALLAVRHAVRTWRHSLLPELHGQVLIVPWTTTAKRLELVIHNAGTRVAKGPMFALVGADGEYIAGAVDSGFLRAGETVIVKTNIEAAADDTHSRGVLSCRDTEENSWAWDFRGKRRLVARWKPPWWLRWRPKPAATSLGEMVRMFHPEIDLDALRQVQYKVVDERSGLTPGTPARASTGAYDS